MKTTDKPVKAGLRSSKQRQVILEELRKVKTHPTADEIYDMVRQRLPRVSLGTVYRNLELLSKAGMIMTLEYGSGRMRFDGTPQNHYHVRCVDCGRVDDVDLEVAPELERSVAGMVDYEVIGHRLEFLGRCPGCRTENNGRDDNPLQ